MISHEPYVAQRTITGTISAIGRTTDWRPCDRNQVAEIMLDGSEPFTLVGKAPDEFILRKPRARPVDAAMVASLRVGDVVRITHKADRTVSFLCVDERPAGEPDRPDTDLSRHMDLIGA